MRDFYIAYQNFMLVGCISLLSIICLGSLAYHLGSTFRNMWRRTRSIAFILFVMGMILYGGSKNYISPSNTSTDENIDLYDISLTISNEVVEVSGVVQTNFVNAIITFKVSSDSVVPFPFWFRESSYQEWTNVTALATFTTAQPVLDSASSGSGTNVYTWTSFDWTNNYDHANWYIGTDLPAVDVDVEGDYIMLDEFCMTSKKVWIKFHIQEGLVIPEGTVIEIQRQTEQGAFEVVDEMPAVMEGSYTWHGFAVGKRTNWRLHMAITKD